MMITELHQKYLTCSSVSIDTRKIEPGALFFALKGEKFDANTFAAKALENGAAYVVMDNAEYAVDERCLVVENTLHALQKLALHHRRLLQIPFIGIGGSNGKTTTKELVNRVLSKKYKTFATPGNYNNYIGVPLTILSLPKDAELAIIELGANQKGDIDELVRICEPGLGLITNIGKSHLEGFGGLQGVRDGEGELYDFLIKTNGQIFVDQQDVTLMDMLQERQATAERILPYRTDVELVESNPNVIYQQGENRIETHLMGDYNFINMRAAMTLGSFFGVAEEEIHEAIAGYVAENNRSQIIEKGSNTIWLDAYNANPSSMGAALKNFEALKAEKKLVILGDMFELGEEGPYEHEMMGKLISECHFDYVLLAGPLMQHALKYLPRAYYFPDKFGLHVWLEEHPMTDTHFLIKGSRGMGLESTLGMIR
ncbi:UDP-N-acetylmuramoyl-tripeptide--D-alanyl-D-alanine ligase [Siphonobacter sp. SORGH_AS_0500]|uniref:UDP-N-acetylmuramoyl-tripeptide--D-alanyl-D- alanine ligase n=1 Tax=Siphonobacter sp. SORGH_AS_0500 TaxID=1864824 RepID=UPI00285884FE|nr:UDP-N-acetylmuramoyl-tripeptide--D-alanyl-D-alanine ligase [Siphonobacter sp. SORGH_AS_0500]MDR6194392.1 UDP-N-acetylmuramoyl-tripeptide--D-alanyl-D-alanine ligase [Siphonobacter sp. SORGH_AS_0500]